MTSQSQRAAQKNADDSHRDSWQDIIDRRLIEWGLDPSQLEEDGLEAPSKFTISLAIGLATAMRDTNSDPPSRVVPDAHGGIVFERDRGSVFESVHVFPDGKVEFAHFKDRRLVHRSPLI